MNLLSFSRLLYRNLKVLIILPLLVIVFIWIFTNSAKDRFNSAITVYTGFASGFNVVDGENAKIDYYSINISFDNLINIIKTKETKEEVALRLLASHLVLNGKSNKFISQSNLDRINQIIPNNILQKIKKPNIEDTYKALLAFKQQNDTNLIYRLLNNETEEFYSIHAIDEITSTRMGSSDMLKMEFESNDPGVCQQVLILASDVLINKYRNIKKGETDNIVRFFQEQTELSLAKLNKAEEQLKEFRSDNRVINYYEQTKFISEKRENIIDETDKERMKIEAARSSINNIEEKLGIMQNKLKEIDKVLDLKNSLNTLIYRKTLIQLNEGDAKPNTEKVDAEIKLLKEQLDEKMRLYYTGLHSQEGISYKELVSLWLENTIKEVESKSRLKIFEERMNDVDKNYDHFAPLGSNIGKMEREIEIAEKEYLSNLASLNAARLREENLQKSSNLQVVDSPYFPHEPQPNKRKLIIISGGLATIIIIILVLLMIEFLDQTIKTSEKANSILKTSVLSAVPLISKSTVNSLKNGVINKLMLKITSKIYEIKKTKANNRPLIVSVVSSRTDEGKTFIANKLAKVLRGNNKKVLLLLPEDENSNIITDIDTVFYDQAINYAEICNIQDFTQSSIEINNFDIIIVELFPLTQYMAPSLFGNSCDLNLLITRGDKLWSESDQNALTVFKENYKNAIYCVLNMVQLYTLESIIGELPSKRGFIRKIIKKWIMFDFSSNKKLSRDEINSIL